MNIQAFHTGFSVLFFAMEYWTGFDSTAWLEKCKANPENIISMDWPFNYIDEIILNLSKYRYVVIPSDSMVCSLLREEGVPYYLCYPARNLKEEYRERFLQRGNTKDFLDVFIGRWDLFMDHLESDPCERKIILGSGTYLSDYFPDVKCP